MYDFCYKHIGTKYDNSAKLLFANTDSLVYEIETNDVYEGFYENKFLFDFDNYSKDSKFFDLVYKKVFDKMKDEDKRKIIREFIELKSKMYSLVIVNDKEIKKAKGVNKNVVTNIRHKEYIDVLFNKNLITHKIKRIQSKLHKIGTYVCTISLSCFNDKRYILDDGINSLVCFHKDLKCQ